MNHPNFPSLLERFFTDRLLGQLGASSHTVASYRDSFRLLLRFAAERLQQAPSNLRIEQLDAPFLGEFLDHLELVRGNCIRTRNNRLAALHAFFQYVALNEPALALHCQRVLAIPTKRYERGPVEFLDEQESAALVAAPAPQTWIGRRDRAILLFAIQTGLRNSEITCFDARTSISREALTCVAWERVARPGGHPYARNSSPCSRNGYRNRVEILTTPCFPVRAAAPSVPTPSSVPSPDMLPQRAVRVRR